MICSACGSASWERMVQYAPFASARLEWTICRQCGSGQASGLTKGGEFVTLIRDTFIGEESVTLGGRTRRRRMRGEGSTA